MSKDLFIKAHEQLIQEYLEANPNATEGKAYGATAGKADDRAADIQACAIDQSRAAAKYPRD